MPKAKLKIVKCTTQELQAVVSLIENVSLTIKEGIWVYDMYKKFNKAFEEAAEADPEYGQVEEEVVLQDG